MPPDPELDFTNPPQPSDSLRPVETRLAPLDAGQTTLLTAPRQLRIGEVISERYRVESRLAAGGMGEVYRVTHVELGRTFAMKVMRRELSNDPEFVERFKREAIASSRIGQQNIVDITDFGRTADGRFYFVMEYLDGETLTALLRREGALELQRVLYLATQLCRALSAAHRLGVVHRDVKPDNVMVLSRPGQPNFVKVLDFGVAKVGSGIASGGHTAIGMVVGTPQYMSPEQAAGLPVDSRSDIYSVGLILYELIAGRPVFQGETPSILMAMHITAPPPPLEPGPLSLPVPAALEALVFRMLEKLPEARPADLDRVLEVIEPLRQHRGDTPAYTFVGPPPAPADVTRVAALPVMELAARDARARQTPSLTALTPPSLPAASQRATHTRRALPATLAEGPAAAPPEPPASKPARRAAGLAGVFLAAAFLTGAAVVLALVLMPPAADPGPVVVPPPAPVERSAPAVLAPEPPAPAPVKLQLQTAPPGAEVFAGDVLVGTTPFTLARPKGATLELRFTLKGFAAEHRKVAFEEDQVLSLALDRAKPSLRRTPRPRGPDDIKDLPF